jgi:phosphatidylinositol glycan class A protein
MTEQDAFPTLTATFPIIRWILVREGIEIVHAHQATSVMANESIVYASALGLPSLYTDHSLFQFDDLAGVILNRVRARWSLDHLLPSILYRGFSW